MYTKYILIDRLYYKFCRNGCTVRPKVKKGVHILKKQLKKVLAATQNFNYRASTMKCGLWPADEVQILDQHFPFSKTRTID